MNLTKAKYLLSEAEPARLEASRAEVAFIGRSNVGKSSLLNALCNQNGLAKVSKTPGRTSTINIFAVDYLRWVVDLPGYGYATGPAGLREKWPAMIEGYLSNRPSLRCIFILIDSKVGPTKLDYEMLDWLDSQNLPYQILANKIDQIKSSQRHSQQKRIAEALQRPLTWVSATEGTGIQALRLVVTKLLDTETSTSLQ